LLTRSIRPRHQMAAERRPSHEPCGLVDTSSRRALGGVDSDARSDRADRAARRWRVRRARRLAGVRRTTESAADHGRRPERRFDRLDGRTGRDDAPARRARGQLSAPAERPRHGIHLPAVARSAAHGPRAASQRRAGLRTHRRRRADAGRGPARAGLLHGRDQQARAHAAAVEIPLGPRAERVGEASPVVAGAGGAQPLGRATRGQAVLPQRQHRGSASTVPMESARWVPDGVADGGTEDVARPPARGRCRARPRNPRGPAWRARGAHAVLRQRGPAGRQPRRRARRARRHGPRRRHRDRVPLRQRDVVPVCEGDGLPERDPLARAAPVSGHAPAGRAPGARQQRRRHAHDSRPARRAAAGGYERTIMGV
jgi:hypothetical protein